MRDFTAQDHELIYFSSISENTHRFVQRLHVPARRISLRPRLDGTTAAIKPYVLITPTYGGGDSKSAVPRQVATFLNDPVNRSLIRGVVSSGNTNFGSAYCLAGRVISAKCGVPQLHRFELLGTADDVSTVNNRLENLWQQHLPMGVAA